jgi:hypothetical protein
MSVNNLAKQQVDQLVEITRLTVAVILKVDPKPGPIKVLRTMVAAGSYAQRAGDLFRSSPVIRLVIDTLENASSDQLLTTPATKEQLFEALPAVDVILGKTPDAENFRIFLYELAQSVVAAAGRGFLGLGKRAQDEEAALLDELKKQLQIEGGFSA